MYCKKCGSKLDKGAKFCGACGTKVNVEAAESDSLLSAKKKKKSVVIVVSIAAAFVILGTLLISLTAFGDTDERKVEMLCDLGDRYLSELEYEQAIAAYEAAIEIDPKAEKAYIGLADAYIGLGDYESAMKALERGIEETDSRKLKDYRDDVQKEWDDRERRICGTVFLDDTDFDGSNNGVIPGVGVNLANQREETATYYTDENGYYDTGKLSAGTYSLHFHVDGYVDYQCEVDLSGGRYEFNVYLKTNEEQNEEGDNAVVPNPNEEQIEEKHNTNTVVLSSGKYMIDIPEGYRVYLRAETDTVVSMYTINKSSGDTEFLSYKEVYYAGRTLWSDGVWRTRSYGDNGYITYLTVYSGSVRADGQKLYYDDETDTSGHWDDYDDLDELVWYSETDMDGIFAVEIYEGQTVTIEQSNGGGTIDCWVQGSNDLTGFWADIHYSLGHEYISTYELTGGGGGWNRFYNGYKRQYTVTSGYMYWFTEFSNKDLLTISFEGAAEPDIPSDVYEFDPDKYMFYDIETITTWEDAKDYCESLGGHLAIITSEEENDFLYQLMVEEGYDSAYFGLTDSNEEGNWMWIDGTFPSYTNWHLGEPNSSNEHYGMFYWKYTDGTWNDGDFGNITVNGGKVFICEWD